MALTQVIAQVVVVMRWGSCDRRRGKETLLSKGAMANFLHDWTAGLLHGPHQTTLHAIADLFSSVFCCCVLFNLYLIRGSAVTY